MLFLFSFATYFHFLKNYLINVLTDNNILFSQCKYVAFPQISWRRLGYSYRIYVFTGFVFPLLPNSLTVYIIYILCETCNYIHWNFYLYIFMIDLQRTIFFYIQYISLLQSDYSCICIYKLFFLKYCNTRTT